jgi:predicted RecA/RadA family phage recombinase
MIGAVLSLAATGAQAGDASDLASRGGFLLGHAYRCGTQAEQLQPSAQLIHDLASALAGDESEKAEADKAFAERFVVSAVADKPGGLVPACASV